MDFVFDTYALIEIIKGNKNYTSYLNSRIIINNFIFAELCYILVRDSYPNADKYLDKYEKFIVSINPKTIKEAMKFRYKNKNKNMSIPDCISYFQSKELDINFLTGDKQFENLENVQFVK
ncbi:MAG: PIN domain-containing protein [Candidatus Pacearchaeota archaeon]